MITFTVERKFVYLMMSISGDVKEYKIGWSNNPARRMKQLRTARPNIQLLHKILVGNPILSEKALKDHFSDCKIAGEWYLLKEEDVQDILELKSEFEIFDFCKQF